MDFVIVLRGFVWFGGEEKDLHEGAGDLHAEIHDVKEVKDEELMVHHTDACVSHPDAMMIDSQRALITTLTMFGPWRHDLLACLTECKLAHFRQCCDGHAKA